MILMLSLNSNSIKSPSRTWRPKPLSGLFFHSFQGKNAEKLSKQIVMNELRRFKHSADFLANSSHIIESAAISAS